MEDGGSGADCKLGLTLVWWQSTSEVLSNWTDYKGAFRTFFALRISEILTQNSRFALPFL